MKTFIFRFLASGIGVFMSTMGFHMMEEPFQNDILTKVNAVIGIIIGIYFVYYGITGNTTLMKAFQKTTKEE